MAAFSGDGPLNHMNLGRVGTYHDRLVTIDRISGITGIDPIGATHVCTAAAMRTDVDLRGG